MQTKNYSKLKILLLFTTISSVGVGWFFYDNVVFSGTITFYSFEGGFYGIISDFGNSFDPIDLPEEFEEDGMRVFVIAKKRSDLGSIHMSGKIIEITTIRQLK